MTVFVYINDNGAFPAEEEVSSCSTQPHGHTEPHVIRHEYEHEEVTEDHLNHVKYGLQPMRTTQHLHPARQTEESL